MMYEMKKKETTTTLGAGREKTTFKILRRTPPAKEKETQQAKGKDA
jgi:hypothetical protein